MGLARTPNKVTRDARLRTTSENISGTTPNDEAPGDIELATGSSRSSDANHNSATQESQDARSAYVFLRTPKKIGGQLIADDEDPPEGWVRELLLTGLSISRIRISFLNNLTIQPWMSFRC